VAAVKNAIVPIIGFGRTFGPQSLPKFVVRGITDQFWFIAAEYVAGMPVHIHQQLSHSGLPMGLSKGRKSRRQRMTAFKVESLRIATTLEKAFQYIADPKNLPQWTHAFKAVSNGNAIMATPAGAVEVGLKVTASASAGTIDWHMTFANGSVASAFSRLVPEAKDHCIYSFILLAPPVPLEQLEGTLNQQAQILREELTKLSEILRQA
jgi:hypothetical protein